MSGRRGEYRVGSLRPSQFLFSNGIGSVVDLPAISAVVMGLNLWNEQDSRPIEEPRLLRVLQETFGPHVTSIRSLPFEEDDPDGSRDEPARRGVPVEPFPAWFVCPFCRMLLNVESGLLALKAPPYRPEQAHYVHKNCRAMTKRPAIPVRFMRACPAGHLDDLPWVAFVHRGPTTCFARLQLNQFGVTGEAASLTVKCLECGAQRSLAEAFGDRADPMIGLCTGRHPHLGEGSDEECDKTAKTISLGASNAWFPASYSVISLPKGEGELEQLIAQKVRQLDPATSKEILAAFLLIDQEPFHLFKKFGADMVWEALERERAKRDEPESRPRALRPPEWQVLTAPILPKGDDFKARVLRPAAQHAEWLERVVLIDRMRLVEALVGFTRLEAPEEPDGSGEPTVESAPLTRGNLTWIPGSEARGEAIFLQFREQALLDWSDRAKVRQIEQIHRYAHRAELDRRGMTPEQRPFPGLRYLLLHSFAHALMRQIAIECGYSAASLRERIYSLEPTDEDGPMAGVLISTSSPDSEGTLGGLVRLGERDQLSWHIEESLRAMLDCASDPYCAEHDPGPDDLSLHGAACHACLLAPETSCERGNRYLDRGVLVETFVGRRASFFDVEE